MVMKKVTLLGDLIFDNEDGVPLGQSLIEQINECPSKNWTAELLAEDNSRIQNVAGQCKRISKTTTHLIVSSGGLDALGYTGIDGKPVSNMFEDMESATMVRDEFQENYRAMLSNLQKQGKNIAVCNISRTRFNLPAAVIAALIFFNEAITTEAFKRGIPVIDLWTALNKPEDFSSLNPLLPSDHGSKKISSIIIELIENHDFSNKRSVIYS